MLENFEYWLVLVVARGLGCPVEDGDLARELTLSLFQAEMEAGALPLQEVIVVSATTPAASVLGPIRTAVPAAVRCVFPGGAIW